MDKLLIILLVLVCGFGSAEADLYGVLDSKGNFRFVNVPVIQTRIIYRKNLKSPFEKALQRAADQFALDPHFLRAVMKAESNFRSEAVSKKGARGLMQLMPSTARILKVSDINNPVDASAVVCVHISQGAVKPLKLGYLHILKPQGKKYGTSNELILSSDLPIIIVEGFTDTGTAMDLGFTAIGRPSAQAGMNLLPALVKGKDVIIVGDNDAGAGLQGLESTFQTLQSVCKSVIKVLPPEATKDLRDWRKKHNLTQKMFLDYVKQEGQSERAANLLPSDIAYNIADFYLQTHKTEDGSLVLRNYKGQWVQYDAGKYSNYEESNLRGEIYRFLDNKNFPKVGGQGTTAVVPFKPSRA
ncbi:hypothetical protein LCGC14_2817400, partial [marine sediment metagenome]